MVGFESTRCVMEFPRILDKYGREQRRDDEVFPKLVLKVDLFLKKCRPFAQRRNRKGSVAWWRSKEGVAEKHQNQQHFISLPDTVRVICSEDKVMRGGYAEIRRVRIEGCPQIPSFWEFAAKRSLNHRTNPELARVEHFNEVMAMRIPHPGVIRFVAVHGTANEGYSYWWNGGTMREMFHLDNKFPKNIADGLANPNVTDDEVVRAFQLARFRKRRTELAWAFVVMMKEVHACGHLHNDISLDNIMLHFPDDESRVYIGVCDWGLATVASQPRKSLFVFTSQEQMKDVLTKRWWVDPTLAYLHKKDAELENIPYYSSMTEEYAVGHIAMHINKGEMSEVYYQLHRSNSTVTQFSKEDLFKTFQQYLKRLSAKGQGNHSSLTRVVNAMIERFNWPIPTEHFRTSY